MSKFCSKCGNELMDEAVICPKCGCAVDNITLISETTRQQNQEMPKTAQLSHYGSGGVYEFLRTLEPNLDFIWAKSGNDVKAQLLGVGAAFIVNTYILAFNTESIYVCQLSKTSGAKIVNIDKYTWSEVKSFTAKGAMVGKMLNFDINNKKLSFRTQKIFSMENQGDRIEKLLQMQK